MPSKRVLVAVLVLVASSLAPRPVDTALASVSLFCDFENKLFCFWDNQTEAAPYTALTSDNVQTTTSTSEESDEDISVTTTPPPAPTARRLGESIAFYPLSERPIPVTTGGEPFPTTVYNANSWRGLFNKRNNLSAAGVMPTPEERMAMDPETGTRVRTFEHVQFYSEVTGSPEYLWSVRRGEDFNQSDHSLKTKEGRFLALDLRKSSGSPTGSSITSALVYTSPHSDACVTFWYVLNDYSRSVSLNIYRSDRNNSKTSSKQWTVRGHKGAYWYGSNLYLPSTGFPSHVLFEGVYVAAVAEESLRGGYIGLDDISIAVGQCPPPGYCDLEGPQCLWENRVGREGNILKFERFSGEHRARENWPKADHTSNSDKGSYFVAFNATEANHVAVLTSEGFPIRECVKNGTLNLWYYLPELDEYEDDEPMSVVAYLYDGAFIDADFELGRWTVRKDLVHKNWTLLSVPFELEHFAKKADMFYLLVMTNLAGLDANIFLAIDDLSVDLNYHCRDTLECEYQSRERVHKDKVCDFVSDCPSGQDELRCGQCNFEGALCDYVQVRTSREIGSEGGWFLSPANTNSSGPQVTIDGREFIMTRADLTGNGLRDSGQNISSSSLTLYSPWTQNSSPNCFFTFFYSVSRYASLLVFLETSKPKAVMNLFDSRLSKNTEGDTVAPADERWTREVVLVGAIAGQFRLRFQAFYSDEFSTANPNELRSQFVALDMVKFDGCAPSRISCYVKDAFQCSNGACVAGDSICDHVDDCGDTSDEQKCVIYPLKCDFEEDMCEWSNFNQLTERVCNWGFCAAKDWKLSSGKSAAEFGPSRDHTTGLPGGNFLLLTSTTKTRRKNSSPIRTPVIGSLVSNYGIKQGVTRSLCRMRFYYLLEGNNYMRLLVKVKGAESGHKEIVWEANNSIRTHGYQRATVALESIVEYSRVMLQGIIENNENVTSYVALDDISFTRGCQLEVSNRSPAFN